MFGPDSVRLVSRNVPMNFGTVATMAVMSSSGITPGQLGICDTNPSADAPWATARLASAGEPMQQILMRGIMAATPERENQTNRDCWIAAPMKDVKSG